MKVSMKLTVLPTSSIEADPFLEGAEPGTVADGRECGIYPNAQYLILVAVGGTPEPFHGIALI